MIGTRREKFNKVNFYCTKEMSAKIEKHRKRLGLNRTSFLRLALKGYFFRVFDTEGYLREMEIKQEKKEEEQKKVYSCKVRLNKEEKIKLTEIAKAEGYNSASDLCTAMAKSFIYTGQIKSKENHKYKRKKVEDMSTICYTAHFDECIGMQLNEFSLTTRQTLSESTRIIVSKILEILENDGEYNEFLQER